MKIDFTQVDGIVSADIFLIFSESDYHYFYKMRPTFWHKNLSFNNMYFYLAVIYLLFADKKLKMLQHNCYASCTLPKTQRIWKPSKCKQPTFGLGVMVPIHFP